ncbi:Prefoldin subunit 6 [Tilletia horrida]|nr:Prefoldin subunit 6 [Tilletia horrida]
MTVSLASHANTALAKHLTPFVAIMDLSAAQKKLAVLSNDFTSLQAEFQKQVEVRQRLDAQMSENENVKKVGIPDFIIWPTFGVSDLGKHLIIQEFAKLTPNNQVYKLIGPALVKQDQAEAKANVDKRIEFIKNEVTRVESKLKEVNQKMEAKRNEIVELQSKAQASLGRQPGGLSPQAAAAV